MRFSGRLKSWDPERGFGFIEPQAGGQDVFVHVSVIPSNFRPPTIGQLFTFEVQLDRLGRKRAGNVGVVEFPSSPARRRRHDAPAEWSVARIAAIPGFVAVYLTLAAKYSVSPWVALGYLVLSGVSLMAYALDKSAARAGRWRFSEGSLLTLGLVGGWPGGLVAQQLLRHKSSKASFRQAFWITVLVNVAAFVGYHVWVKPASTA